MKIKKLTALGCLLFLPLFAFGEELTGYDIAKTSYNVDSGRTAHYEAVLTLLSKNGGVRSREISLRKKQFDGVKKSLITFSAPKDVAGVAYLAFDHDEKEGEAKESENWLYMPALKKIRRISGSARQDEFMGSDFTYEDIADRGLYKDNFTLVGEETAENSECWKIDCVAKDSSEKIPRRILWIRKDNYLPQKAELYDQRGELQRTLVCSDISEVDGIWTIHKMVMTNVQTGHSSVLEMKNVKYNMNLSDNLFTVANLERGLNK